jgi:hypothetical protein
MSFAKQFVLVAAVVAATLCMTVGIADARGGGISVSPSSLSFGGVPVGTTKVLNLTLMNTSNVDQAYGAGTTDKHNVFNFPGGAGTCNDFYTYDFTLTPGESCIWPMGFSPQSTGHFRGTVDFGFCPGEGGFCTGPSTYTNIRVSGKGI